MLSYHYCVGCRGGDVECCEGLRRVDEGAAVESIVAEVDSPAGGREDIETYKAKRGRAGRRRQSMGGVAIVTSYILFSSSEMTREQDPDRCRAVGAYSVLWIMNKASRTLDVGDCPIEVMILTMFE